MQRVRAPESDYEERLLPDVHPRRPVGPAVFGVVEYHDESRRERRRDEQEDLADHSGLLSGLSVGYPRPQRARNAEGRAPYVVFL